MPTKTSPDGICGLCKRPFDDHPHFVKSYPNIKCPEQKG